MSNNHGQFRELLQGAIGSKDAVRLAQPQKIPDHAADKAIMLRTEEITN